MSTKKRSHKKKEAAAPVKQPEVRRDAAGRIKRTPLERAEYLRAKAEEITQKANLSRIRKENAPVRRALNLAGSPRNLGEIEWITADLAEAARLLAARVGEQAQQHALELDGERGQGHIPGV